MEEDDDGDGDGAPGVGVLLSNDIFIRNEIGDAS